MLMSSSVFSRFLPRFTLTKAKEKPVHASYEYSECFCKPNPSICWNSHFGKVRFLINFHKINLSARDHVPNMQPIAKAHPCFTTKPAHFGSFFSHSKIQNCLFFDLVYLKNSLITHAQFYPIHRNLLLIISCHKQKGVNHNEHRNI